MLDRLAGYGVGDELQDIDLATAPRLWPHGHPFFLWVSGDFFNENGTIVAALAAAYNHSVCRKLSSGDFTYAYVAIEHPSTMDPSYNEYVQLARNVYEMGSVHVFEFHG